MRFRYYPQAMIDKMMNCAAAEKPSLMNSVYGDYMGKVEKTGSDEVACLEQKGSSK